MPLHHAIISLKKDYRESGSIEQSIARIHELTHQTKLRCSDMGLHAEDIDSISLRIYGTAEQIALLVRNLREENHLQSLRVEPLEKIPYAETGSGD